MPKKNKQKVKEKREVPLQRTTVLSGHVSMLVPGPITNSGRADGGWMDRVGITAAGLGFVFGPPNAMGPIDAFYSNDAYARPGFCTTQVELHPPLETIGDPSTRENLTDSLKLYCHNTENEAYQRGEYSDLGARRIDDPAGIGSSATMIVHVGFENLITPTNPNLPPGLTAKTYVALIHFAGKGNVLFKANNFERNNPPLDYEKLLASFTYEKQAPYLGPDPTLSGLRGLSVLLGSRGGVGDAKEAIAQARSEADALESPRLCFKCKSGTARDGGSLQQCSRCHIAIYCSRECQSSDWKRHKRSECNKK